MWKKTKRILFNQQGSQFLEGGLWIILIVFTLAVAGFALASTVSGKYNELETSLNSISVPKV